MIQRLEKNLIEVEIPGVHTLRSGRGTSQFYFLKLRLTYKKGPKKISLHHHMWSSQDYKVVLTKLGLYVKCDEVPRAIRVSQQINGFDKSVDIMTTGCYEVQWFPKDVLLPEEYKLGDQVDIPVLVPVNKLLWITEYEHIVYVSEFYMPDPKHLKKVPNMCVDSFLKYKKTYKEILMKAI